MDQTCGPITISTWRHHLYRLPVVSTWKHWKETILSDVTCHEAVPSCNVVVLVGYIFIFLPVILFRNDPQRMSKYLWIIIDLERLFFTTSAKTMGILSILTLSWINTAKTNSYSMRVVLNRMLRFKIFVVVLYGTIFCISQHWMTSMDSCKKHWANIQRYSLGFNLKWIK